MKSLLWCRVVHLKKNYKLYLLMFILPLVFFFAFGMGSGEVRVNVIITDEEQSAISNKLIEEFEVSSTYNVIRAERDELYSLISEGKVEVGLIIENGSFNDDKIPMKLVKITDSVAIASFEGTLRSVVQKLKYEESVTTEIFNVISDLNREANHDLVRQRVNSSIVEKLNAPSSINLKVNERTRDETAILYDHQLHVMLGFTLFFSIYTIMFSIGEIMNDKKHGVWNRIVISPITKLQLYLGNFLFSFAISFSQMTLLVLLSKYLIGVNWGDNLSVVLFLIGLYIFAVMAIGMFLVSVTKTVQQLNSVVPIFAVSSAMIGGAYWPLEIVTSEILIFLSKLVPVTYAMSSIREVILLDRGWDHIIMPAIVLLLMGVFFMTIGIQLLERKSS